MIISPSHTIEYKPNDIIITSSFGDVLLHHPKYRYVPRLHLQRFRRWSLGTTLDPGTFAVTYRTGARNAFHHVTVSRGHVMTPALASARMRASLSRCVIARAMRGPDSRQEGAIWESTWPKTQRADTARVLPVASCVASSLAEPRPRKRMPDSASTLCSSAKPRSI